LAVSKEPGEKMGFAKRLEIGFKNFSSALLKTFLAQPPAEPRPPFQRILYLRYGGLGDMLLTLPVLRTARARFPAAEIDVLCDPKNVSPLSGTGLADHIFYYRKDPWRVVQLIKKLRKRKYDYICNLLVYPTFTFGFLARLIGPRAMRAAGDQERFAYFYNRVIELPPKSAIPMIERLFLLSTDITGGQIANIDTPWMNFGEEVKNRAETLYREMVAQISPQNHAPRLAAVNLTAGLKRREWPLEKYAEFLQAASERYRKEIDGWIIFTDPRRMEDTAWLVRKMNHQTVIAMPPADNFQMIIQFLNYVFILITPDTAFTHAASAMGTPVVNLMIRENLITWPPVGVPHRIVSSEDPKELGNLPVEAVLKGFGDLLKDVLQRQRK
jgi:ADP-heptose:LPS heptosyltransferase